MSKELLLEEEMSLEELQELEALLLEGDEGVGKVPTKKHESAQNQTTNQATNCCPNIGTE